METEPAVTTDPVQQSEFDIRINNTFIALRETEEPISVDIAKKLLQEINSMYSEREKQGQKIADPTKMFYKKSYKGIYTHVYSPQTHTYHKQNFEQHNKYVDQSGKHTTIEQVLSLSFITFKHPFLYRGYSNKLRKELQKLTPVGQKAKLEEGAYDIYDYELSTFELRYNDETNVDKSTFTFFFAIRLSTESMSHFDDFLDHHLTHNFGDDVLEYNRFLTRLCSEYKDKAISKPRRKLIESWQEHNKRKQVQKNNISSPDITLDVSSTDAEIKKEDTKPGRKVTEKISLPMPAEPINNDLTAEATAILFKYLREGNVIYGDDTVSNTNAAIAIRGLTGFSEERLRKFMGGYKFSKKAKKTLRIKLQSIIALIMS